MENPQTPKTYYLSIAMAASWASWGLSTEWAPLNKPLDPPIKKGFEGYWLIVLDRTNPGNTPHINGVYADGAKMLQAIGSCLSGNSNNCIVIVIANGSPDFQTWNWDQTFIEDFGKYGAGGLYKKLCQEGLLLNGSFNFGQSINYCLISVPTDAEQEGYEAGATYGTGATTALSLSCELIPVTLPNGTTFYRVQLT